MTQKQLCHTKTTIKVKTVFVKDQEIYSVFIKFSVQSSVLDLNARISKRSHHRLTDRVNDKLKTHKTKVNIFNIETFFF